ncbi:MAG TPA: hypothetical protein VGA65_04555 [Hyphomicrobium sp.]|jgi:hypothetical protein
MRPVLLFVAALIALASVMTQARARLQPDITCIDPDMEFPVACDEDDD